IGGAAVPISIGTPGQSARLTFDGAAGQRVSLSPSNLSGGLTSGSMTTILKPDGSSLAQQWTDRSLGPVALPVAGTYTVLVDPNGASTGGVTLTLSNVAGAEPPATTNVSASADSAGVTLLSTSGSAPASAR